MISLTFFPILVNCNISQLLELMKSQDRLNFHHHCLQLFHAVHLRVDSPGLC